MIVSQRDSKWSSIKVGDGSGTIGQVGCTITCLGYLVGLTPDKVNEKLKSAKGYQVNLVIWSKTAEAIGVASYRYTTYNNNAVVDAISKNGAVLGEVDAKAIGGTGKHWVVMTGSGKVQDPWFGEERPTSNYTFTGYTVVVFDKTKLGKYEDTNMYRGYDLTNRESMKICVDQQIKVTEGLLVDKSQYESIKGQLTKSEEQNEELSKQLGIKTAEAKANFDEVQKRDAVINTLNEAISKMNNTDNFAKAVTDEQEAHNITKTKLDALLWDMEDTLKLSHTSTDMDERIFVALEALGKLHQTIVSYEDKVKDLEKEVKKLTTQSRHISKLSIKDCIILLIDKIKEKYGKK